MTYIKPEVIELVRAAQAAQGANYDDSRSDKVSQIFEFWIESTSSGAAYETDE